MRLNKTLISLLFLSVFTFTNAHAAQSNDSCGSTTVTIKGQEQNVTDAKLTSCKEDVMGQVLNTTVNEKDIAPSLYNSVGEKGAGRIGTSTQMADGITSVKTTFSYIVFMVAALVTVIIGFIILKKENEDQGAPFSLWVSGGCALLAVIISYPYIGANHDYLLSRIAIATSNYTSNKVKQNLEIAAMNKSTIENALPLASIGNANALISIAQSDVNTTREIDISAYMRFEKDTVNNNMTSFVKRYLTYPEFLDRLHKCSTFRQSYVIEQPVEFNIFKNTDVSWAKTNPQILFNHVASCSNDAYNYKPEIYGYTWQVGGHIGRVSFPTLGTETRYFSPENYKEMLPTIKNLVDEKTNFMTKDFSDTQFNSFSNSIVRQMILDKINNGTTIDIKTLRNESFIRNMFKVCAIPAGDTLKSLSQKLNKSKAAIYYDIVNECRDGFYGKNKNGLISNKAIYNSALEIAGLVKRFSCGMKDSGQRLADSINETSSGNVPFNKEKINLNVTSDCFYFDKDGIKFAGVMNDIEAVDFKKRIMLLNNLLIAFFDQVEYGRLDLLYSYYTENENEMTIDDKIKLGASMNFANEITKTSSDGSAMYDANAEIVPNIKSLIPWYEYSNFLATDVMNEKDYLSEEAAQTYTNKKIRLTDYLNSGDASMSGQENTLNDFMQPSGSASQSMVFQYLEEIIFGFPTPNFNRSKGMDGNENLVKKTKDCSLKEGRICYNGGNTFDLSIKANYEILNTATKFYVAFKAIKLAGNYIDGAVDDISAMAGGVAGTFMKWVAKIGGAIVKFVTMLSGVVAEYFWQIIIATLVALGTMYWVIVKNVKDLLMNLLHNLFSSVRIAIALLSGSISIKNDGLEYVVRSYLYVIYKWAYLGAYYFLFTSIFSLVDAVLWALTCDLFNGIKMNLNEVMAMLFNLSIFVIAPLQTCLSVFITLSIISNMDDKISDLIQPGQRQTDSSGNDLRNAGGGALLQRYATNSVEGLKKELLDLKAKR